MNLITRRTLLALFGSAPVAVAAARVFKDTPIVQPQAAPPLVEPIPSLPEGSLALERVRFIELYNRPLPALNKPMSEAATFVRLWLNRWQFNFGIDDIVRLDLGVYAVGMINMGQYGMEGLRGLDEEGRAVFQVPKASILAFQGHHEYDDTIDVTEFDSILQEFDTRPVRTSATITIRSPEGLP